MHWNEARVRGFFILIMEARADSKKIVYGCGFRKNIGSSEAHGEPPQPYHLKRKETMMAKKKKKNKNKGKKKGKGKK